MQVPMKTQVESVAHWAASTYCAQFWLHLAVVEDHEQAASAWQAVWPSIVQAATQVAFLTRQTGSAKHWLDALMSEQDV